MPKQYKQTSGCSQGLLTPPGGGFDSSISCSTQPLVKPTKSASHPVYNKIRYITNRVYLAGKSGLRRNFSGTLKLNTGFLDNMYKRVSQPYLNSIQRFLIGNSSSLPALKSETLPVLSRRILPGTPTSGGVETGHLLSPTTSPDPDKEEDPPPTEEVVTPENSKAVEIEQNTVVELDQNTGIEAGEKSPAQPPNLSQVAPDEKERLAVSPGPVAPKDKEPPLEVMLITEGTYPYYWGGVSTWAHLLIRDLPEVNFTLFSLVANPNLKPLLNLLPNVVNFHPVPLWGVREVLELNPRLSLKKLRRLKHHTNEKAIETDFIPALRGFLSDLFLSDSEPERLASYIHRMYLFFQQHDFDTVFRSQEVWDCFGEAVRQDFPVSAARHGFEDFEFSQQDIMLGLHWLYHWLFPLARPIPRVDVTHAATAGISTLIGTVAKLEYGSAFLLSEHGIYLRERYLAEAAEPKRLFPKLFTLRFARRMTDLSYALCDQISPCCDYNQRWEIQNGASADRLRTIYYGADADKFYAGGKKIGEPPVIVWVGRINPLKDLLTLLEAAALVHKERPDIEFRLFGNPAAEDQAYYEDCLALHKKLDLQEVVKFAGYASNPATAYNQGDVVLLSSISEGFPFATLEAMLCGKPVVATSVGGLPEQVEGCGIVVEPRNPAEMAKALLTLMNDPALCEEYGKAARLKALKEFSIHQSREAHLTSYLNLSGRLLPAQCPGGVPPRALDPPSSEASGGDPALLTPLLDKPRAVPKPAWTLKDLGSVQVLTRLVIEKDARPLDYLEVAALLESMGITDEISSERFGAPDTFELSKVILKLVRSGWGGIGTSKLPISLVRSAVYPNRVRRYSTLRNLPRPRSGTALARRYHKGNATQLQKTAAPPVSHSADIIDVSKGLIEIPADPASPPKEKILHYSAGAIALFPGLVIILLIQVYSFLGNWDGAHIMALSLGISGGLLIASSLLQSVLRRASICLSLNNFRAARRFLAYSLGLGAVGMVALTGLALAGSDWIDAFSFEERLIFSAAFLGISLIWLSSGPLALIQKQIWVGLGLLLGLLTLVFLNWAVSQFSEAHLLAGTIGGFLAALGLIIFVAMRGLKEPKKEKDAPRQNLPSPAYLFYEGFPYLLYGLLYITFITVPHFMGWFGKLDQNTVRQNAITGLEVGLTFALPSLMLAGGVTERTIRLFWKKMAAIQASTPGTSTDQFSREIATFYTQQREWYEVALLSLSLILGTPIWLALQMDWLAGMVGYDSTNATIFFLFGLVTYYMIGQGLFNCSFLLTLAKPLPAVRALWASLLILLVTGLPLSLVFDFRFCLVGFVLGAWVFMAKTTTGVKKLFVSADYYYFAAL